MVKSVTENGILDQERFDAYKRRSVTGKFWQQLFLGLGGATFFGLVGALATGGMTLALTAEALALPVALAVFGIACIYLGSKHWAQNIMLDQDFQAKKIGIAARGIEPELQPNTGRTAPLAAAPSEHAQASASTLQADRPTTQISNVQLQNMLTAADQSLSVAGRQT